MLQDLEKFRISRYEQNQGIFLIHSANPSNVAGQVADIVISLYQHGNGPLDRGEVEKVEYSLGPKFHRGLIVKTDSSDNYSYRVSAYGPMLCVARVFVQGIDQPIVLERYINLE